MNAGMGRRLVAEAIGTGLLVAVVVGSGVMAERLSPDDTGLQLLQNSLATTLGLAVLILALGPVSGAHFNPVVSAADAWLGRNKGGLKSSELGAYVGAQIVGGIGGALLANAMFAVPLGWSTTTRGGAGQWLGEFVATAGLVFLIFALVRSDRARYAPAAVGAYIGAAYWFTSSTSFANPAVTIARAFSDTFAGIAPGSVLLFVVAQLAGAAAGVGLALLLYPSKSEASVEASQDSTSSLDQPRSSTSVRNVS